MVSRTAVTAARWLANYLRRPINEVGDAPDNPRPVALPRDFYERVNELELVLAQLIQNGFQRGAREIVFTDDVPWDSELNAAARQTGVPEIRTISKGFGTVRVTKRYVEVKMGRTRFELPLLLPKKKEGDRVAH